MSEDVKLICGKYGDEDARSRTQNRPLISWNRYSGEWLLTHCACDAREYIVGVASDQTNGSDDKHQNHGQHHCVLRDVLPLLV